MAERPPQSWKSSIQQAVLDIILPRMTSSALPTEHFSSDRINFLQCLKVSSLEIPTQAHQLLQDIYFLMSQNQRVTDEDMCSVLALVKSTDDSDKKFKDLCLANPTAPKSYCYLHSLTLPPAALKQLADKWMSLGLYKPITEGWLLFLNSNPGQNYHMRYVGQRSTLVISSPRSSLNRRISAKDGFFTRLFRLIEGMERGADFLRIHCQTYYVEPCHPSYNGESYNLLSQKSLDEQEQLLIHFFGLENLLNMQPGGRYTAYAPEEEAFRLYCSLPTKQSFFVDFQRLASLAPQEMAHKILEWTRLVESEWCRKQATADDRSCDFPAGYLDMIYRQALPKFIVNNHVVVASISSNIPTLAYSSSKPFYDPSCGTTEAISCEHLTRLEGWQAGSREYRSPKSYVGHIPFANLLPWINSKSGNGAFQEGCFQLNTYMRIIKPLITIAVSCTATKFAYSNFIHPYGFCPDSNFTMEVVGIPRTVAIHDYAMVHDDSTSELSSSSGIITTLVIPHLHPGVDRYTSKSAKSHRLIMDITWQITLYVCQMATLFASMECNREAILDRIAQLCISDSEYLDPTMSILFQRLQDAKTAWSNFEVQVNIERQANAGEKRFVRTATENPSKIERYGAFQGAKYSPERRRQGNLIWKQNYHDLHVHWNRSQKEEWYQWFLSRAEGKCILASAMGIVSAKDKPKGHATAKRYRPQGVEAGDESWMQDPNLFNQAMKKWYKHITAKQPADFFSSENQAKRRNGAILGTNREILEGLELYRQKKGYLLIHWKTPEDNMVKFKVYHSLLRHDGTDKTLRCRLNFVEDGMTMTMVEDEKVVIKLTMDYIVGHSNGKDFYYLWVTERTRITGIVPEGSVEYYNQLCQQPPAGRPMLKKRKQTTLESYGPIEENDSVYLLKSFLDEKYPRGGIMCFGLEEYYAIIKLHCCSYEYGHFIREYADFIEQERFSSHPFLNENRFWLTKPSHIHYFLENVTLLRPEFTVTTENVKKKEGKATFIKKVKMLKFCGK